MRKLAIAFVWTMILVGLLMWLASCATFEAEVTMPNGEQWKIKSTTLGKDIVIDPNGLISTVSPKNQGILEAIGGFIAGILVSL